MNDISECAMAYLEEYGAMPNLRAEQDRYSSFKFGFEAGQRSGIRMERRRIIFDIENREDFR